MHAPTPIRTTTTQPERRRPGWLKPGLLWFAADLLGPTGLLYLLLWMDYSLYAALLASAAASAVSSVISYRRGQGSQRFAPYMLTLSLLGFGIALVAGSDRFLLARESVLTAAVGCWFLGSLWATRPLAYQFSRPLLEGRFGTQGISWELLWEREPRFRHIWRVLSSMWAVAMFIDAVVRVIMAYTLPVHTVPALQTGLMIATTAIMQVVTNVYFARVGLWPLIHESGAAAISTTEVADVPERRDRQHEVRTA